MAVFFCRNCNGQVRVNDKLCSDCGVSAPALQSPVSALDSACPRRQKSKAQVSRGNQGVVIGGFACAFAILGIFTVGLLFVPIAALFTLSSFFQSFRGDGTGTLVSLVAAVLTGIGFATSPVLWLATAGLFASLQDQQHAVSVVSAPSAVTKHVPKATITFNGPFDGLWVRDKLACVDEDDQTRTLIQFDNKIEGKLVPLFDQYENHCVIADRSGSSSEVELSATCFEFWDDFTKRKNGKKTAIKLSRIPGGIAIDGTAYSRCEPDNKE